MFRPSCGVRKCIEHKSLPIQRTPSTALLPSSYPEQISLGKVRIAVIYSSIYA
jgi:hypothetical protein